MWVGDHGGMALASQPPAPKPDTNPHLRRVKACMWFSGPLTSRKKLPVAGRW